MGTTEKLGPLELIVLTDSFRTAETAYCMLHHLKECAESILHAACELTMELADKAESSGALELSRQAATFSVKAEDFLEQLKGHLLKAEGGIAQIQRERTGSAQH